MTPPFDTSTLYLGALDVARIVARKGLSPCIEAIAARIEADFRRWPAFDKTARVANHSVDGVIELMPVADQERYAFKYVNGHPKNTQRGASTVMAFAVLADVSTGAPRLLAEFTLATALRTAAMSAVAARALARTGSRTMALVGNGAQSEFQAIAMRDLLGVRKLRLFDVDVQATAKLLRNLQDEGFETAVCANAAEAVHGADIVTTVTADKTHATIVTPDMVAPGMHLNAVGGDCPGKTEIHADVLRAAKVFVEYEPQTRIEGDLQQMAPDFAVTELWRVLAGEQAGRDRAAQITMFDSVGFALEDFSALRYLYEMAQTLAIGGTIPLIPRLDDPKDLYQLIKPVLPAPPAATAFVALDTPQPAMA